MSSPNVASPVTPSSAAPRSNALQNRITSVLSASYADLEIRDALSILDARHVENTAELRRNLRLDVQQELIQCNGEIVHDFGKVAAQLQRVGAAIATLNQCCDEIKKHVDAADRETGPMLEEASGLLSDKQDVEIKQRVLEAFKAHFVLSDADLALLTSTAEPVNEDFFRLLTRLKKVHQDSQILLGYENQELGLEILEQSSRQLNSAFQKLYRWVQREFKMLDLENPQISAAIRRALRVLAEKPTLFQNCLDFLAEAREDILSNNFYAALTGSPVDQDHPVMGKAIELSAHDPLRYISDMLAWVHSATVSEKEALEVLFISEGDEIAKSIQAGIESEPWSRDEETDEPPVFDGRTALRQLVDRDLTSVFRQLKQRTEQVIQSHQDLTLAYKISNIVYFYCGIFAPLIGTDSAALSNLRPVSETAMRSFRAIIRDHVATLQTEASLATDDLTPPEFLTESLESLEVLMKSYDTSVVTPNHAERAAGFQPILHEALDPFLAGCESITRRLRSPDDHIFALNCLQVTRETLQKFSFADRTEDLQTQQETHQNDLTTATHTFFMQQSGLQTFFDMVGSAADLEVHYKDPSRVRTIAQQLDAFLPTATDDARNFLGQLQAQDVRSIIIERAAERFCEDFEEAEEWILSADAQMDDASISDEETDEVRLRHVFPRTSNEIRVLLS